MLTQKLSSGCCLGAQCSLGAWSHGAACLLPGRTASPACCLGACGLSSVCGFDAALGGRGCLGAALAIIDLPKGCAALPGCCSCHCVRVCACVCLGAALGGRGRGCSAQSVCLWVCSAVSCLPAQHAACAPVHLGAAPVMDVWLWLKAADARDVVVVVTRWFGGVLLGPQRFALINNTARMLLEAQVCVRMRMRCRTCCACCWRPRCVCACGCAAARAAHAAGGPSVCAHADALLHALRMLLEAWALQAGPASISHKPNNCIAWL